MKTINISVPRTDIAAEIAKWAHTIGENIDDQHPKQRHFVQGAADKGHIDVLMDTADDAWSDFLQIVAAYTTPRCQCGCNQPDGDGQQATDGYSVTLYLPDNTYPNTGQNVQRLARRLVTLRARAEWERLTMRDPAQSDAAAELAARRIKAEISIRTTQQKTASNWFYGS